MFLIPVLAFSSSAFILLKGYHVCKPCERHSIALFDRYVWQTDGSKELSDRPLWRKVKYRSLVHLRVFHVFQGMDTCLILSARMMANSGSPRGRQTGEASCIFSRLFHFVIKANLQNLNWSLVLVVT